LIQRYNADLANGLGNLASRTLTMIRQYREGAIPDSTGAEYTADYARATASKVIESSTSSSSPAGWNLRGPSCRCSTSSSWSAPRGNWRKFRFAGAADETLYTAAESLRIICGLLYPVMPETTAKIWSQLGMTAPLGRAAYRGPALGPAASGAEDRRDRRGLPAPRGATHH